MKQFMEKLGCEIVFLMPKINLELKVKEHTETAHVAENFRFKRINRFSSFFSILNFSHILATKNLIKKVKNRLIFPKTYWDKNIMTLQIIFE
jgi:hypothetical protein